jgi:acetyltransferase
MTVLPPAAAPPAEVVLGDGARVRVRPMRTDDREMYARAVAGMSPRSRYLRFASPMPRLNERLLNQLMGFDGDRHVAIGALTADESALVGVVRYVRTADGSTAEVAIGVADLWQARGLGRALLGRIIEHARAAGVAKLTAVCLSENRESISLARWAGFVPTRRSGASTEYELALTGPPAPAA